MSVSKGGASAIFFTFGMVRPPENKEFAGSMCYHEKNHSLDVNNQNLEQMYMDKLVSSKRKHVVCKNIYNDRDKRPPSFFKS